MKTLLFLSLLIFASLAFAFQSGDKIDCWDNVSRYTYKIKIVDIGDEDAYIKVKTDPGSYFYPSSRVIFNESSEGATFEMISKDRKTIEEEIFVPYPAPGQDIVYGDYTDMADSRRLRCKIL